MPKITKRNGSYTTKIYDKVAKKQRRITAPTRKELLQKMAEYKPSDLGNITLKECVKEYIDLKAPVLSPATVYTYRNRVKYYDDTLLRHLTDEKVQEFVSKWSEELSYSTVCGIYNLMRSALKLKGVNVKATLPKKKKPNLYIPTDKDVEMLLDYFKGTDMEIAILLAVYIPMRKGEICALNYEDIRGGKIHINKTMVYNKEYSIKDSPKSYAGFRSVELPQIIADKIPKGSGKLLDLNPNTISHRFIKALNDLNLHPMRFHDLRHYGASKLHAMGIPDIYIIKRGGWENVDILRRVYEGAIKEDDERFTDLINAQIKRATKSGSKGN